MATIPAVIHRYQIINRIGQGGMGSLYLGRDPALDRLVAVKVLREGFDNAELRERFAREARSAARLSHVNIVTIFDVGEHEGEPFIAMEYVPGETIGEMIRRRAPLSLARKLQFMEDLCTGLAHAHKAKIVHRDIKPANLMVSPEGVLKILDFGIARVADSSMTQSGVMVGTLNYMAPEQMAGQAVDHRCDIFAVGAVFYEIVSYRQAFPGTMTDGIFNKILHEPPEPLARVCPGLDQQIIHIVEKALEKDPGTRYKDLDAMRKDIARVRQRIEDEDRQDPTVSLESGAPTLDLGTPARTPRPTTRKTERDLFAKRRAAEIETRLQGGRQAFESGDYEAAIATCEQVLLIDPDHDAASDLRDRARAAVEARQINDWMREAHEQLQLGALTAASQLVDRAQSLDPTSARVVEMRRAVEEARREHERARERALAIENALARARASITEGAYESAIRAANEALAMDATHADALALKQQADDGLKEARRGEEQERLARRAVDEARQRFADGDHQAALSMLEAFQPPHDLVRRTLDELRFEADEIERRRRRLEQERQERLQKIAAHLDEARAAVAAGRFEAAFASLDSARALDPDAPGLAELARETEARQAAALEDARIEAELKATLSSAAAHLERNELDRAQPLVDKARGLAPADPRVAALAARIQQAAEWKASVEAARRLKAQVDEQLAAAAEHLRREDLDGARRAVDAALALAPQDADALRVRAEVGRAQQAAGEAAARRIQDVGKKLAHAAEQLRRQDFTGARRLIDAALQLDPQSQDALALRAEAARAEQALAEAAARLTREVGDKLAEAAGHLREQNFAGAKRLVEVALHLDPASQEALALQTEVRRAEQAAAEAAARLKKELGDKLAKGSECLRRKDFAGARALVDAALQLDPQNKQALKLQADVQRAEQAAEAARRAAAARAEPAGPPRAQPGEMPPSAADAPTLDVRGAAAEAIRGRIEAPVSERVVPESAADEAAPQPARRPAFVPVQIGAAAAVLLLLIGGGWWVTRSGAPEEPPPSAGAQSAEQTPPGGETAPPPVSDVRPPAAVSSPPREEAVAREVTPPAPPPAGDNLAQRLAGLRSSARQQLRSGQRELALSTAQAAVNVSPGDADTGRVLEEIRRDAEQRASTARDDAAKARAQTLAPDAYKAATAKEQDAARLRRAGRSDEAIRSLWSAAELFRRATVEGQQADARRVVAPPPSAGAPPGTPAPEDTRPRPAPAGPTPAPPPAATERAVTPPPAPVAERPAESARPAAAPANEDAAVREALRQYEAAYESLDPAAVKRIVPALDVRELARTFDNYRAYSIEIAISNILFEGSLARVVCVVKRTFTPKAGRGASVSTQTTFRMQKTGSAWVVVGVEAR